MQLPPVVCSSSCAKTSTASAPGAVMAAQKLPMLAQLASKLYCTTPMRTPARLLASSFVSSTDVGGAHECTRAAMAAACAGVPRSAASMAANASATRPRHVGEPPTAASDSESETTSQYPVKSKLASTGDDVENAKATRCGRRARAHADSAPG